MEVPATVSGKLLKITVALGDKVHEDQVIAVVEVDGAAEVPANQPIAAKAASIATAKQTVGPPTTRRSRRRLSRSPRRPRVDSKFECRTSAMRRTSWSSKWPSRSGSPSRSTTCWWSWSPTRRRWKFRHRSPVESRRSMSLPARRVNEGSLLVVIETTEAVPVQAASAEKSSEVATIPAPHGAARAASRRLRPARRRRRPPVELSMPAQRCAV